MNERWKGVGCFGTGHAFYKQHETQILFKEKTKQSFRPFSQNFESGIIRPVATSSERLCITMRYLVTRDAQMTISTSYRTSTSTVGRIIKETCDAICKVLKEREFRKAPCTKNESSCWSVSWAAELSSLFRSHRWETCSCSNASSNQINVF